MRSVGLRRRVVTRKSADVPVRGVNLPARNGDPERLHDREAFLDPVQGGGPVLSCHLDPRLGLPRKCLQIGLGRGARGLQKAIRFCPGPSEVPGGQPHIAQPQLCVHPPVPVQEELRSDLGVQDRLELSRRFLVPAVLEVGVPRGEPDDCPWAVPPESTAQLPGAADHRAQPRFAKAEQPGIASVLLSHRCSRANDAHQVAELAGMLEGEGSPAQGEEVRHQAGGLVHGRNAGIEIPEGVRVFAFEQLQVRVDHAVIRGQLRVGQAMDGLPRRRAGVPVLRPPRVVEQSAAGRQQPDVGLLQGIVEARGEVLGLLDRRDAPIRFDEAERTNQAAERMHSRGSEAGSGRPSRC